MKFRSYIRLLTVVAMLPSTTATIANAADPAPRQPPTPPLLLEQIEDMPGDLGAHLHQRLTHARQQLEQQLNEVRQLTGRIVDKAVDPARLQTARLHAALTLPSLAPRRSGQTLLIHTRELDAEAQAELAEDLAVMSRILEKVTTSDSELSGPRPMGIDLVFALPVSPVRSLYLDGYGALFLVNVGYPLLPAVATDQEANEEPGPESETVWEQTRQELYGIPQPPSPPAPARLFGLGWTGEQTAGSDYDAARVDALRQALLATIKNTANIRQLSDEELVTICVTGSPAAAKLRVRRLQNPAVVPGAPAPPARAGTSGASIRREDLVIQSRSDTTDAHQGVMTLQARKSDIDRFAAGDITPDEFQELVRIQIYPSSGGWNAGNPWNRN
jgi:hypothetical protein